MVMFRNALADADAKLSNPPPGGCTPDRQWRIWKPQVKVTSQMRMDTNLARDTSAACCSVGYLMRLSGWDCNETGGARNHLRTFSEIPC